MLYTDGLSEAHDAAGREYGAERLSRVLSAHCGAAPDKLIDVCLEDLRGFLAQARTTDDLSLMVLRRTSQAGAAMTGAASA